MNKKINSVPQEYISIYNSMITEKFHVDGSRIYIAPRKNTIVFLLKSIIEAYETGTPLFYLDFNIGLRYKDTIIKKLKLFGYSNDVISKMISHFTTNNLDHHGPEFAHHRTAAYAVFEYMSQNNGIPSDTKIILNHCDADSVLSAYLLDNWSELKEADRDFIIRTTEICDYIATDSLELEKRFFDIESEDYPQNLLNLYIEYYIGYDTPNIRKLELFMKNYLGLDNPISSLIKKSKKSNRWKQTVKKILNNFENKMQQYTSIKHKPGNVLFLSELSQDLDLHYSMLRKGRYIFGSFTYFNPFFESLSFQMDSILFEEKNQKIKIKLNSESSKSLMTSIEKGVDIAIDAKAPQPDIEPLYKLSYLGEAKQLVISNYQTGEIVITSSVVPMNKYVAFGYNGNIATLDIKEMLDFIRVAEDRKRVGMLFEKYNIPKVSLSNIDATISFIQSINDGELSEADIKSKIKSGIGLFYNKDKNNLIIKVPDKGVYLIPLDTERILPLSISESWQSNRESVGTGPFDGSVLSTEELNNICSIFYKSKVHDLREKTVSRFTKNIASKNDLLINNSLVPLMNGARANEAYYINILSSIFSNISFDHESKTEVMLFRDGFNPDEFFKEMEQDSILSGYFEELKTSYQEKYNLDLKEELNRNYSNFILYSEHLKKMGVPDMKALNQCIQNLLRNTATNNDIIFNLNDLADVPNIELVLYQSMTKVGDNADNNYFNILYIAKQLKLKGYKILGFKTHIHKNSKLELFDILSTKNGSIYLTKIDTTQQYSTVSEYVKHLFPEGFDEYSAYARDLFMDITKDTSSELFIHLIKSLGIENALSVKECTPMINVLPAFPNTLKPKTMCDPAIKSLAIDKELRLRHPEMEYIIIDSDQIPHSNEVERNFVD